MSGRGVMPKQGQLFAQTMALVRQLDLRNLRQLGQAIEYLIIKKKSGKTNEF